MNCLRPDGMLLLRAPRALHPVAERKRIHLSSRTRLQVSPILRKYVSDDLFCDGLLGRQKQVVGDRVVADLHRQRIRDELDIPVPASAYRGALGYRSKAAQRAPSGARSVTSILLLSLTDGKACYRR